MKKTICGVDVSKAKLDVCIEPGHRLASFNNDTAGIAELAAFCREHAVTLLVMEASGGYERRAFVELWEKGISCALTNPRNVRRYAEAMGILEKTDRIGSFRDAFVRTGGECETCQQNQGEPRAQGDHSSEITSLPRDSRSLPPTPAQ